MKKVLEYLQHIEELGYWYYSLFNFSLWFEISKENALLQIKEACDCGIIKHLYQDFYFNPVSKNISPFALEDMIPIFRPNVFSYVSFEKILFQYGVIQECVSVLTVATNGSTGKFTTPEGNIWFDNIELGETNILFRELFWDQRRLCCVATPLRAYHDLEILGRNLDLVDLDLLEIAIESHPQNYDSRLDDMPIYINILQEINNGR